MESLVLIFMVLKVKKCPLVPGSERLLCLLVFNFCPVKISWYEASVLWIQLASSVGYLRVIFFVTQLMRFTHEAK